MPSISLEYKESWPTYEVSMTLCCNPYNFLVTNYFEVEDAVYPFFSFKFLRCEATTQSLVDFHIPEIGSLQYFITQSFIILCNQYGFSFYFSAPCNRKVPLSYPKSLAILQHCLVIMGVLL